MPATITYPHIVKADGAPARLIRTPRVRVAQVVMAYFHYKENVEALVDAYEYLSKAEAHAAMLYYWDHREEIDAEIAEEFAIVARWDAERREALPTKIEQILQARRSL